MHYSKVFLLSILIGAMLDPGSAAAQSAMRALEVRLDLADTLGLNPEAERPAPLVPTNGVAQDERLLGYVSQDLFVRRLGLATRDRILAIDGAEPSDPLGAILERSADPGYESFTISILRGSELIDLKVKKEFDLERSGEIYRELFQ